MTKVPSEVPAQISEPRSRILVTVPSSFISTNGDVFPIIISYYTN